jgi:hypothetical protein
VIKEEDALRFLPCGTYETGIHHWGTRHDCLACQFYHRLRDNLSRMVASGQLKAGDIKPAKLGEGERTVLITERGL